MEAKSVNLSNIKDSYPDQGELSLSSYEPDTHHLQNNTKKEQIDLNSND